MSLIKVKENESFEAAMRRFKKQCEKAGVLLLRQAQRTPQEEGNCLPKTRAQEVEEDVALEERGR
jgi:hypothetical protein